IGKKLAKRVVRARVGGSLRPAGAHVDDAVRSPEEDVAQAKLGRASVPRVAVHHDDATALLEDEPRATLLVAKRHVARDGQPRIPCMIRIEPIETAAVVLPPHATDPRSASADAARIAALIISPGSSPDVRCPIPRPRPRPDVPASGERWRRICSTRSSRIFRRPARNARLT